MKTAFFLRHADAEANGAALSDRDRPLSSHGQQSADLIGGHLAARIHNPLLILCSSAQRTVETLDRVRARLSGLLRESIEPDLYLAGSETLLDYLQQIDDAESNVLFIAHNPGLASLAADLVSDATPDAERMRRSFPSASVAEIQFHRESWSQIRLGSGSLHQFTTPQDLR